MRISPIAIAALAAACSQAAAPAATSVQAPAANASGQRAMMRVIDPTTLVGLWSFDRSCGLYDLVLRPDGTAEYYDYADASHVVTRMGTWAADGINRIALDVRREGAAPEAFSLEITAPGSEDLVGTLSRADGGAPLTINAKRCPEEDRD